MQIVVEGLDASGKESICSSHGEFGNDPKQLTSPPPKGRGIHSSTTRV